MENRKVVLCDTNILIEFYKGNPDIVATCEQYFQEDEEDRLNKIDGLLNKLHPFVSGPISRKINAYEPTLNISDAVAA